MNNGINPGLLLAGAIVQVILVAIFLIVATYIAMWIFNIGPLTGFLTALATYGVLSLAGISSGIARLSME